MKIAIVGTGISGLTAAHLLNEGNELTVFETRNRIGGHTHTVKVERGYGEQRVDTGFIVFNDWTYPNFIKLLDKLGVESQPTEMSFSVKCERTGLEYNGTTLNTLFAQRRNLFRPSFYRMIRDILRFNKESLELLESEDTGRTMAAYLREGGYSAEFIDHYIVPMGAAIWSANSRQMNEFPARYFVEFFNNHGMLSIDERPQWRVIKGGSCQYLKPLIAPFKERIRHSTPVDRIQRFEDHVELTTEAGITESFDAVVLAVHSDQALKMLGDPSQAEREILGAIPYQKNDTVLHTDAQVLPKRKLARAAWNYHIAQNTRDRVAVTYDMNNLQRLNAPENFCVSLNYSEAIDPSKVIKELTYFHPTYTPPGVAAQKRKAQISGVRRTYYCGAYWGYGFHEDGVNSALEVCSHFGRSL